MAINTSKVIVGGIVGGIVANVIDFVGNSFILGGMHQAEMTKLNPALAVAPTGGQIAGFVVFDIIWIMTAVWIYAAIRPRFGPGPKTAVYAAVAAWLIGSSVAGFFWMLGIFGTHLFFASAALELVNGIVSTLVGAWLYTEEPA